MRPGRALRAGLRAAAAAGVLALAGGLAAAPASAHNVVVGTSPGTDETVTTAPDEVSVTFDDVVLNVSADGSSTAVQVTGPDGAEHADGCPTTQDRTISVPVVLDEPGTYTVAWRVVSADGHPTSGEFAFTYAPEDDGAASTAGDDGGREAKGCGSQAQADGAGAQDGDPGQAAGEQAAEAGDASGGSDLPVVLGIAAAVVVLAGAGVVLALRLGRRRS